jgi:predicted AAA+ superfamily ATPase
VGNQFDRDQKVIELIGLMKDVYLFIDEIQSLREKNKTLDKVIKLILQQTFESAIFIQEYAGCGFAST